MEFFKEIAYQRAARRMWARILREKFSAKNPKSYLLRQQAIGGIGASSTILQRPLNNITRGALSGVMSTLSGGPPVVIPYDEPLGLGWSLEASQIAEDGARILQYEAKLTEVRDPLAGSYYVESLTNEIEAAGWEELERVEAMGGAVAAIENGYIERQIAKSAHERQQRIERGEDLIVGVNCFIGENELEVTASRLVPHPYDPAEREETEERQIADLAEVKRRRDKRTVAQLLNELKMKAKKEEENLIPHFIECNKAYVTQQEMCDVLREVFGETITEV